MPPSKKTVILKSRKFLNKGDDMTGTERPHDYLWETIQTYDQLGEEYLETTKDLLKQEEYEKLASMIPKDGKVLDAGCGYGKELKIFADAGYNVTGVDLSERLLDIAQKLAPKAKLAKMDVRNLGLEDEHFDAVWCNAVLLHLKSEDAQKALAEFYRVLKPSGVLYVLVRKSENQPRIATEQIKGMPRLFHYYTEEELRDLVQTAGFGNLEISTFNERKRYGPDKRDIDLLEIFARKRKE